MISRRYFHITMIVLAGWLLPACSGDNGGGGGTDYDRTQLLANLSDNIILPAYETALADIHAMETAWNNFNSSPSGTTLDILQTAVLQAYESWQKVAFFDFGPADDQLLMSSVNVFPTNTAKIEDNIATANFNLDLLANQAAKGFPALDYLLFHTDDGTLLTEFGSLNRETYTQAVIDDIVLRLETVVSEWQGDYAGTFKSRKGNDASSSIAQLLNAYIQYFESDFRDDKIGIPAGVRTSGVTYPEKVEAYFSGTSLQLAIASIIAMENVYLGKTEGGADGVGIKEHLEAVGATDLAADIAAKFTSIKAAINAIPAPLSGTINSNNAVVLTAYNEIQSMVALLKVDMSSALSILITYTDNDGD